VTAPAVHAESRLRAELPALDVFADETRPFLQGARLTVWELQQDHIPATLITDNMAGHFLKSGRIGCVVVGADRIAANGDVANKIGTYSVAVLAKENGVPFFVAAPISTLDLTLASGDLIPIERRPDAEVTHVFGTRGRAGRHAGGEPGVRCDAQPVCDGDYYRAGSGAGAVCGVVARTHLAAVVSRVFQEDVLTAKRRRSLPVA
jgi:eIF-2B alpha/beta/delta-like uncharacterized protein